MNLLVINCGSSSIKFAVFEDETLHLRLRGLVDRIGGDSPKLSWKSEESSGETTLAAAEAADHEASMRAITNLLASQFGDASSIHAVGHRVVHGAERFQQATVITDEVQSVVESCSKLAPLHNPANLTGIAAARSAFPEVPQVAVFDTAFHQSIPPKAYLYPLPIEFYREHGIRRYGFHGSSHRHVLIETAKRLDQPVEQTSLISAHLGNGCSAAAISNGQCVDTTMGLTPLEGLVMGTRCGDIDPGIPVFLHRELGLSFDEIDSLLNKRSGLLGLSQLSNDMRELAEAANQGNEQASIAIEIFIYRLAKAIAALRVPLPKCDAISFTGGIGENSPTIRARTLQRLSFLGISLDSKRNEQNGDDAGCLATDSSPLQSFIVAANEELAIAQETKTVLAARVH